MKKLLCTLTAVLMLLVTPVKAETRKDVLRLKDNYPQEYVVVKGDTLWDISAHFLESPWKWPEIWGMNAQIPNPHLIYPGDTIYLVWVNGKPRLKVKRGMRKLSPTARVQPLDRAIPAIPLKDILSFLKDNRVLEENLFLDAPYIIGSKDQRIIAGAGDRVYARGALLQDLKRQGVYRASGEYTDPDTQEFLGYELLKVADVTVAAKNDDIVSLNVKKSELEIRIKDRVIPAEEQRVESIFYPMPSPPETQGKILSVLGGVRDGGQFNVVALNLGLREHLKPGHVFAIYRSGESIVDPITQEPLTLPSERSGVLMVFKSFEKVSYGLIMQSTNVVSVGDQIREP
ncbi:MAG: LysM peptidoglycan-binding domain-containing protein [Pontibacterium sp.]